MLYGYLVYLLLIRSYEASDLQDIIDTSHHQTVCLIGIHEKIIMPANQLPASTILVPFSLQVSSPAWLF